MVKVEVVEVVVEEEEVVVCLEVVGGEIASHFFHWQGFSILAPLSRPLTNANSANPSINHEINKKHFILCTPQVCPNPYQNPLIDINFCKMLLSIFLESSLLISISIFFKTSFGWEFPEL